MFKKLEKRRTILSIITSFILTLLGYFGTKFKNSAFNYTDVVYTPLDVIIPIIIFIILLVLIYLLFGIKINYKEDRNFKVKRWQIFLPLILVSAAILLIVLPGHYPYDSQSMYYFYSHNAYTTHFSPAITWLIGAFITLGQNVLGSANAGYILLISLQILFLNYVITETIFYCSNKLKRKSFLILSILYFTLHPLIQVLLIRSGQDTIFGGLFLFLCLEFLKISEDEKYFNKKSSFIKIFFITFLLLITRNNGLYAIIPTLLTGLFVLRIRPIRRKFFIAILIPVVVFFGYKNLFIKNIVSSNDSFFQETLNVPTIQIARSMYYNPDDESLEELKEYYIEGCTDWQGDTWGWYRGAAAISDPYKSCYRIDKIEEKPFDFIKLWAKIGSKNIDNYIEAVGVFELGLYHPGVEYTPYNSSYMWHTYVDGGFGSRNADGLSEIVLFPKIRDLFYKLIIGQKWADIPILNLLWRGPFTTFLWFFAVILVFLKRRTKYLLPLSLIFGLIATVALSPVVLFRYLFPAVICAPIMAYIIVQTIKKGKDGKKNS